MLKRLNVETMLESPRGVHTETVKSRISDAIELVPEGKRADYVLRVVSDISALHGKEILRTLDRVTEHMENPGISEKDKNAPKMYFTQGKFVGHAFKVEGRFGDIIHLGTYLEILTYETPPKIGEVKLLLRRVDAKTDIAGEHYRETLNGMRQRLIDIIQKGGTG